MFENNDYILDLMVNFGQLEFEVVSSAREDLDWDGEAVLNRFLENETITEEGIANVLAQELGMGIVNLEGCEISDEVIQLIEPAIARKYKVVPVDSDDFGITVAMADPSNFETLDNLRFVLKTDVQGAVGIGSQIKAALDVYYKDEAAELEGVQLNDLGLSDEEKKALEGSGEDAPIIRLVTMLILDAYKLKASDIHLEPLETSLRVRYRIDGVLRKMQDPPKYLQNNILSRLKIMAGLKITEKRVPQDGRISIKVLGKDIDLRVSTVPTTHGESIVMRILDKNSISIGIPELGFFADDQEIIDRVLSLPDGIFLVTGPTGSGKTTSLYAFLNSINEPSRKIITAEDPVEYELSGINQVQIDNSIGMTFAGALRSMLRQAPNVIMVGEIRDMETGAVAINASLTGHIVFSTLHTNDAPGAITRMIDMGIQPFLVAASVRGVMAQRLLRKTCKKCAKPYTPSEDELRILQVDADYFAEANLQRGSGCSECTNGYKGRMGAFEIFEMNDSIRELIYRKASSAEIKSVTRGMGMRTLREDALRKAAAGLTSLEEVIRITVVDED